MISSTLFSIAAIGKGKLRMRKLWCEGLRAAEALDLAGLGMRVVSFASKAGKAIPQRSRQP
jgi:hypothetical protein